MWGPGDCRRQADLAEQAARVVSLSTDKQALLAMSRTLRERAERLEMERRTPKGRGLSTRSV